MKIVMPIGRRGDKPLIIVPRGIPRIRMPQTRYGQNKCLLIAHFGTHTIETLPFRRWDAEGEEHKAWDNTIIVSEPPNRLRTIDTSCCLAIAMADTKRLVGAAIHIYFPRDQHKAMEYALWAMNSKRKDVVIGLSGMMLTYTNGSENKVRAEVAMHAGRYGRVIYNQLGKKGDIAIDFKKRQIYYPNNSPGFPYISSVSF
jgi:hypothetical protein